VERAVASVIEAGMLTPDLGGKCGTQEVLKGLLSAVKQ
jgi:isocitrate/isopropylmalate dehydrogenase